MDISCPGNRASALETDTVSCRCLAPHGLLIVFVPCKTVWNSRVAKNPLSARGRSGVDPIPQSAEDLAFGKADLASGYQEGIYRKVSPAHTERAKRAGSVISSSFTVWQESSEGRKGRFVVNLSRQSTLWKKGSIHMEYLPEFGFNIQQDDHFISFDIRKGYRHFRLAPSMRDWFNFHYSGQYYQCVALDFGWGRSTMWFTQMMDILVQEMRRQGMRVLAYLDDFLVAPSPPGTVASKKDCLDARVEVNKALRALDLARHPEKGEWFGSKRLTHLGVELDSSTMKFHVVAHKVARVKELAAQLLRQVRMGRRWVYTRALAHFCGVCVSQSLAMPWARFYTRSLYWDTARNRERDRHGRCRLSHQSVQDLKKRKELAKSDLDGRAILPLRPQAAMHTDAADAGFGGTLNLEEMSAGKDGQNWYQGVWSWRDRAHSITLRELKAIRMLLMGKMGQVIQDRDLHQLLLHVDNPVVVNISNLFVSSSRQMKTELRRQKRVLDMTGLHIRAAWLPSVANRFADALSRRLPSRDLQIRRRLRRSVLNGMMAPLDAFPYRPLGEHPVFLRRQTWSELEKPWGKEDVRLLCPPVDLITATLSKLRTSGSPALLMIPKWPLQPWYSPALAMSSRVTELKRPLEEVWDAQRRLNAKWRLFLLEVNL